MKQNKNKHSLKIAIIASLVIPILGYVLASNVFGADIRVDNPEVNVPIDSDASVPMNPEVTIPPMDSDTTAPMTPDASIPMDPEVTINVDPDSVDDSTNKVHFTTKTDTNTNNVEYYVEDNVSNEDIYLGTAEK